MRIRALTTSELAKALVEKRGSNTGMNMGADFSKTYKDGCNHISFLENEKTGDSSVWLGKMTAYEGGFGCSIRLKINYSKLKAAEKKEVVEFLKSEGLI